MTQAIDPCVAAPVSRLRDDLLRVAARELVAVYIHGSAVLGDFVPGSSDLDVLIVAHHDIEQSVTSAIATTLAAHDPTPAVSIEASVVTRSASMTPHAPWPFLVHVTNHPDDSKVVWGRTSTATRTWSCTTPCCDNAAGPHTERRPATTSARSTEPRSSLSSPTNSHGRLPTLPGPTLYSTRVEHFVSSAMESCAPSPTVADGH